RRQQEDGFAPQPVVNRVDRPAHLVAGQPPRLRSRLRRLHRPLPPGPGDRVTGQSLKRRVGPVLPAHGPPTYGRPVNPRLTRARREVSPRRPCPRIGRRVYGLTTPSVPPAGER